MTSEEIQQKQAVDLSATSWMREIAYQLALLNEKPTAEAKPQQYQPKQAYKHGNRS